MKLGFAILHMIELKATMQPWEPSVVGGDQTHLAKWAEKLGFEMIALLEQHIIPRKHVGLSVPFYFNTYNAMTNFVGVTEKVRVNSAIAILPAQSPVVTAKALATMDWLSRGRLTITFAVGCRKKSSGCSRRQFPGPQREGTFMASTEIAIANLVHRHAELIDSGDVEGAAAEFIDARIKIGEREIGSGEVLQLWRNRVMMYEDSTPRTKHVITNPIIEVDEAAGTGTCRTYYTVMQQIGRCPLKAATCGRYHDSFERIDGQRRFAFRECSLRDLPGDMSRHSRNWQARAGTKDD